MAFYEKHQVLGTNKNGAHRGTGRDKAKVRSPHGKTSMPNIHEGFKGKPDKFARSIARHGKPRSEAPVAVHSAMHSRVKHTGELLVGQTQTSQALGSDPLNPQTMRKFTTQVAPASPGMRSRTAGHEVGPLSPGVRHVIAHFMSDTFHEHRKNLAKSVLEEAVYSGATHIKAK